MERELQNIRRLAETLRENLMKCADNPDEDPVHDLRTGTRRLQASLENLLRELRSGDAGQLLRDATETMLRLLKKVRRAAGPVRDLDVHRKLLDKLVKRATGVPDKKDTRTGRQEPKPGPRLVGQPDALETREAGLRATDVQGQAGHLDDWLKHRRNRQSRPLQKEAAIAAGKLDKRLAELEAALRADSQRTRNTPAALMALESFARLATEMQHLHAGNLHEFRKGAKKARYVAELAAQDDAFAGRVAKALKKLQDEIGDWHDWLVLAEEAHAALGDQAQELTGLIEGERERHFVTAMKAAVKLRGQLMGEWLAVAPPPRRRPEAERKSSSPRGATA